MSRHYRKLPVVLGIPAAATALLLLFTAVTGAAPEVSDYVGSEVCTSCHTGAAKKWAGSHHAKAWTLPSPETIVADFDGTVFEHRGMTARFRIGGDGRYHVTVTETDGATTDYAVHSVAGIEPLQQYLLETEPGRIQSFDVVWDTLKGRWFHLYPDQDLAPDNGLHWTGPYKTWNSRCAECHATGYEKKYSSDTRSFASRHSEIGVGCEACHGPGAAHVAWANGSETAGDATDRDAYGFSQSFATTEAMIQQCATCHSRREAYDDASPLPGTPFSDSYGLSLLRPGLYHADGQILDEVYVYGSFLQSKMYAKGVGCVNCHDAHSAELVADGNAVCTQCHGPGSHAGFPSLVPADYDSPAHHFHESGTDAAQCKTCHMPERVYMGNDWRADHSFRIPRPDLSGQTGAPDVCTGCHDDKTPRWAATRIAEWYPESDNRGPHFGTTLARGRDNPALAAADLEKLAADISQPGIVRATALRLLEAANDPDAAERLAPILGDDDPLVRAAAARLQRTAETSSGVPRLLGALDDQIRLVRISAAQALLGAPIARLPDRMQSSLDKAMHEWRAAMASRLDFPETHLQIAGMALTMRSFPAAKAAFREVVRLDPQRADAWIMLVRLAAATEGAAAARAVLGEALQAVPENPTLLSYRREFSGE